MKKSVCLLLVYFLSLCAFSRAPKWVENLDATYPLQLFVRATGEGNSLQSAKDEAVASIALYFNADVKSVSHAQKTYVHLSQESGNRHTNSEELTEAISVTTNAEFLCVQFADGWQSEKTGRWTVLAYIDRNAAMAVYRAKIGVLVKTARTLYEHASAEQEPFFAVQDLQKAAVLMRLSERYRENALVLKPAAVQSFSMGAGLAENIASRLKAAKRHCSFSSSHDDFSSAIAVAVEKAGFIFATTGGTYRVTVTPTFTTGEQESGAFVYAQVAVTVTNSAGKAVSSYAATYPRYTHDTATLARTRAVTKIRTDLSEKFLSEYRE